MNAERTPRFISLAFSKVCKTTSAEEKRSFSRYIRILIGTPIAIHYLALYFIKQIIGIATSRFCIFVERI